MHPLIASAALREQEVVDYQTNIDSFTIMLTLLPQGDWPTHIADYANPSVPVPPELDDDVEDEIANYRNRDMLRARIRAEKGQQRIARLALAALKIQIGADYDAELAAFRELPPAPVSPG